MPYRIQRKRIKGWRLPPNTVCVTRGTRYGNPFKIDGNITREMSIELFKRHLEQMGTNLAEYLEPLRGRNVACFCAENEACHGDWLLEKANGPN